MKKNIGELIGKTLGDLKILKIVSQDGTTWHNYKFLVECVKCGAVLTRNGQTLKRNPLCNRNCYQGLFLSYPWKDIYANRYGNIVFRCKNSKYYKHIECKLSFYEFMEEMIKLQKSNCFTNEQMIELTVDRIDNNKHYEKGNLRLATKLTQVYNRRIKPNHFTATNHSEFLLSNSSTMVAKYLGVVVAAVNNCIAKRSHTCQGYVFTPITEEQYYKLKSVTTKAKIFHREYE